MNEAEFTLVGTVPEARLPALYTLLTQRCGAATQSAIWERRYQPVQPSDTRGLGRLVLTSEPDGTSGTLRAESVDRLAIAQLIAPRPLPLLLARRVARVPVDAGAPHFVASLGYKLQHEALRRGQVFRDGVTTISVLELCRCLRFGGAAQRR